MNTSYFIRTLYPALLLAVAGQAHAQMYSYTDLGAGEANAINNAGVVVGDNLNGTAVLWTGTTETNLGQIGHWDVAYGINSAGQAVGYYQCSCVKFATQWNNGVGSTLTPGGVGVANGINNAGQAVGYEYSRNAPNTDQAVIWNNGNVVTLSNTGNFTSSVGTAINNHAQEVGYLSGGSTIGVNQAVLWNGTTPTLLTGLDTNASTEAFAVNDKSQIAGYSAMNNITQAVLWSGNKATALKSLGGTMSVADGINNAGQAVGYSYTFGNVLKQAVLWENGKVIDLNNYMSASLRNQGWVLENATAINDNGTITGDAINTWTGKEDAVVLSLVSCVPEPATGAMFLAGLGMIAFTARRRKISGHSI